jgi:hypothetical protein
MIEAHEVSAGSPPLGPCAPVDGEKPPVAAAAVGAMPPVAVPREETPATGLPPPETLAA